jgi:hypothetical protein
MAKDYSQSVFGIFALSMFSGLFAVMNKSFVTRVDNAVIDGIIKAVKKIDAQAKFVQDTIKFLDGKEYNVFRLPKGILADLIYDRKNKTYAYRAYSLIINELDFTKLNNVHSYSDCIDSLQSERKETSAPNFK